MNFLRSRLRHRDQQGVAIVLALAFIVLVGVVTTALLSSLTSAVNDRTVLDSVRNRQYAADAAIERDIARVRGIAAPGPALNGCPPGSSQTYSGVNALTIRVECTNVPTFTTSRLLQRNVVFASCVASGSTACGQTTTPVIVRAQVNYEAADAETPTITKTYIQSWTVTR